MSKYKFDSDFPSDLENARNAAIKAINFIHDSIPDLKADDMGDLKLIFCELLFNAVIHGNNKDASKKVILSIEIEKNEIVAVISDEGNGFDFNALLERIDDSDPIALFSENGRGIRLVMKLTDDLTFKNRGSQIIFHKRVSCYG